MPTSATVKSPFMKARTGRGWRSSSSRILRLTRAVGRVGSSRSAGLRASEPRVREVFGSPCRSAGWRFLMAHVPRQMRCPCKGLRAALQHPRLRHPNLAANVAKAGLLGKRGRDGKVRAHARHNEVLTEA